MKNLIVILTLSIFSHFSFAGTAQILRAQANPAHIKQAVTGGVILLNEDNIKLTVFYKSTTPGKEKQKTFEFEITDTIAGECGSTSYISDNEDHFVALNDFSGVVNCDTINLFPTQLIYTTFDGENEYTSKFSGSSLVSLDDHAQFLQLGVSTPMAQPPTIYQNRHNHHDNPVILPVIELM